MTIPDRERFAGTGGTEPIVQIAAMVIGAVLLLLGIAGFIPGITSEFDTFGWAGHHSGALLLGVFAVSALHNLLHATFGVTGLLFARAADSAQTYLLWGGVVYGALWLYGLVIDHHSPLNFLPVNMAHMWLHLGLAVAMLTSGLVLGRFVIQPDS